VKHMSNHDQAVPVVQDDTLVYLKDGQDYRLSVDTPAWYAWLSTATSFAYRSEAGTFTARREQAGHKRGGWYWRAYRKRGGKLQSVYVGKSEELTLERLRTVAAILAAQHAITGAEQEQEQSVLQGHAAEQEHGPRPATGAMRQLAEPGTASEIGKRPVSTSLMPLTLLIGREREVAAACTLLARPEVRLLTLTGAGGVGKTRLALQIAAQVQDDFQDGMCLVSLAPIRDSELVLPTLVQAFGLPASAQLPLEQLQAALQDKHLLLVLDNFEQVIAAALSLVELLGLCPGLKLLVTSREVLHVRGERTLLVPPLALPDLKHLPDWQTLSRYGAVALFVERAQEVLPGFQVTADTARLIAEICVRLDGLPLALELAAARLKLLSLQALRKRLTRRLALLTGGARDLPARQQTLRSTVAWSYDLLVQEEQRLFRLLSVFVGGCTLQAIEALSSALGGGSAQILDGVTSLLDKHLLYQIQSGTTEPRFGMLETIREFGLESLTSSGELEQTRHVHTQYYLRLVEEGEAHLFGAEQAPWFDQLEREHDNLRAALGWSAERTGEGKADHSMQTAWRLTGAMVRFWVARWCISEGRFWLERALANHEAVTSLVRIKTLSAAAWLFFHTGDVERAEELYEECLHLYQESKEITKTWGTYSPDWLGWFAFWLALRRDNDHVVRSLLEESRALAREAGDKRSLAILLHFLACSAITLGEYREARSLLEESLALSQEMNYKQNIAWSFFHLGRLLFTLGEEAQAHVLLEDSLVLSRAVNEKPAIAVSLYMLGRFALAKGEVTDAQALLGESLSRLSALRLASQIPYVLSELASVSMIQHDEVAAGDFYKKSLELFRQMNDREGVAYSLQRWGSIAAQQGAAVWAARLWGTAETLHHTRGLRAPFLLLNAVTNYERANYERMVNLVRAQLGKRAFVAAWAQGRAMTPEQSLAAREQPFAPVQTKARTNKQPRVAPSYPNGLTEREVEVLRLVARGLSDAQVAQALVISPRTVNAHLRSIYSKLNITSRTAATHFAIEQRLL
jgi:predicted ATPase/DNA-binding CsgD family transcriptional regulator